MTDLTALRKTLLDEPELQDVYAHHLIAAGARARPILAEAMKCYEKMIGQNEGPGAFEN